MVLELVLNRGCFVVFGFSKSVRNSRRLAFGVLSSPTALAASTHSRERPPS